MQELVPWFSLSWFCPWAGDSSAWAVQGLGTHQAASSLTSPDSSSGIRLPAGTRTRNPSDSPELPRLHRSGHCPCHSHLAGQGWHSHCCQLEGHGSGNGSGPAEAVPGEDEGDQLQGGDVSLPSVLKLPPCWLSSCPLLCLAGAVTRDGSKCQVAGGQRRRRRRRGCHRHGAHSLHPVNSAR